MGLGRRVPRLLSSFAWGKHTTGRVGGVLVSKIDAESIHTEESGTAIHGSMDGAQAHQRRGCCSTFDSARRLGSGGISGLLQGVRKNQGTKKGELEMGRGFAALQQREERKSSGSKPMIRVHGDQMEHRWSEYVQPTFEALFVDACGTLLTPAEPAAEVYLRYGAAYGVSLSEKEVLERYRRAYSTPWAESSIRYVDDGKPFWRFIVSEATGMDNEAMFEDIYEYYAGSEAWKVAPGAEASLLKIRSKGIKTAIVSNFDSRLHKIMEELGLSPLFDEIVVSADVGAEKPNPILFLEACERLHVSPEHVIHVGDDRRNDLYGARDAGCFAWLWGDDVKSFEQVRKRLETGNLYDSLSGF
eukprot:jgi/Picsp_1/3838/NSC_01350-R1_phosphoglycolate phosphatase